jgi:hypothetical protein
VRGHASAGSRRHAAAAPAGSKQRGKKGSGMAQLERDDLRVRHVQVEMKAGGVQMPYLQAAHRGHRNNWGMLLQVDHMKCLKQMQVQDKYTWKQMQARRVREAAHRLTGMLRGRVQAHGKGCWLVHKVHGRRICSSHAAAQPPTHPQHDICSAGPHRQVPQLYQSVVYLQVRPAAPRLLHPSALLVIISSLCFHTEPRLLPAERIFHR